MSLHNTQKEKQKEKQAEIEITKGECYEVR